MAITPLPPAPEPTDSTSEFNSKAFAFVGALDGFVTETNALAVQVDADKTTATGAASTATTGANTATTQAGIATTQAGIATSAASEAAGLVENYQGALASDPSLNKDGDPLVAGDWYVNTSTGLIRAYTGSAWVTSVNVTAGVTSFSGGTTGLTPSTGTQGDVTLAGTLGVANGGTGAATLAANNVLLGNGTGALQVVAPGTTGNILTSNGTTWASSAPPASGSKAADVQTFTSSGTWTKPTGFGAKSIALIEVWGGGGSGGGGRIEPFGKSTRITSGSGGGGGAYFYKWIQLSDLTSTVSVTIGAGGASVTGATGNAGGNTSFGSFITIYGGNAGQKSLTANGGAGGGLLSNNQPLPSAEGFPGNTQGGSSTFKGGGGGGTFVPVGKSSGGSGAGGASVYGGGGGGGGIFTTGTPSAGGISVNSGAGGRGGNTNNSLPAIAGSFPSGGGGGSYHTYASGAGANGKCVVTVFDGA